MADLSIESIFSPEIIADPYPMYRQLREGSPVLELPAANMVILSRYRDVQAALRNKKLGHGTDPRMSKEEFDEMMSNPAIANLRRTMLLQNPPDHTRLRGLVVKAFDARRVEAMRVRIRAIANELVDGFIEDGSGDLVRLFIHPLPVIVICVLLGVPNADRAEFVQGTRISGRLIDPSPQTMTRRLLTIWAFRSSSRATTALASRFLSARSTMLTAPSTIFRRAAMMA